MDLLKRNFVNKIIDGLKNLNGTEFEYFSDKLFSLIILSETIHKGHTRTAKPAGYTADFHDIGTKLIGQCGSDEDYFDGFEKDKSGLLKNDIREEKPIKDFLKSVKRYPQAAKIYLFSNQVATGNKYNEVNKAIEDVKQADNISHEAELLDAQRIAEIIFLNLSSTTIIEHLLEKYLPIAFELYKIFPNTNALPDFKGNYYNRNEEKAIRDLTDKQDFIQIYGLSGIGKSEITISIAKQIQNEFDTIIWIDADNILSERFNFQSIKINKFDSSINLAYILENYKTLVIFDNLNYQIQNICDEFRKLNKKNSRCLITSLKREVENSNAFQLGYLDDAIAKEILLEAKEKPTNEQINTLLAVIGGYPLILKILVSNINLQNFTWSEIIENVGSIKDLTDNERNLKIADILIGRIKNGLEKELAFIKYLGQRKISRHFAKYLLQTLLNKLENTALINKQDLFYYNVHQIILDTIINQINLENHEIEFDATLSKYLFDFNETKTFEYFRFIYNHFSLLTEKWLSDKTDKNLKKRILYAITQATDINNNPQDLLQKIESLNLSHNEYYDILLEIERGEIYLFTIDKKSNRQKYENKANEQIENLTLILQNSKNANLQIILIHHIGKLFLKINNLDKALEYFNKVLELEPNADYALLQIARIYFQKKDIKLATEKIEMILGNEKILENISVNVLLSFYELISNSQFEELSKKYIFDRIEAFFNKLFMSIDTKFDQPYRLLKKLAKSLSYLQPEYFKEIVQNIPLPSNIGTNRELQISYAEILSAYYRFLKYKEPKNNIELTKAYNLSESYLKSANLNTDFERNHLLNLYIDAGELENAIKFADLYDDKDEPFYNQKLCKIHREKGNLDMALVYIDSAINAGYKNKLKNYFIAAFLNDKAEVLNKQQSKDAIIILEEAIKFHNTPKTIDEWNKKLDKWKNENK
jgi:hypothetical protein